MIPFTTPTFMISIQEDGLKLLQNTDHVWADFRQGNYVLTKKSGVVIDAKDGNVAVGLTQEESGKFKEGMIEVQLHGITKSGEAWKTYAGLIPVDRTLTEEVIT